MNIVNKLWHNLPKPIKSKNSAYSNRKFVQTGDYKMWILITKTCTTMCTILYASASISTQIHIKLIVKLQKILSSAKLSYYYKYT